MSRMSIRLSAAVVANLTAGLLALCLAAGSASAADPPHGSDPWAQETSQGSGFLADLEIGMARLDHADVAQAVARCDPKFENPLLWSAATSALLLQASLLQASDPTVPIKETRADDTPGKSLHLTSFQKAALSFSDKLSRDRFLSRYELDRSRLWAYAFQVIVVGLGALATIFIGIRSVIVKENDYVTLYACLAIAFSASGTAVATLSTFADYQTTQLRASRTLAQLQQLHWRVISDVTKNTLICSSDSTDIEIKLKQTDAWGIRYETIQDGSVVSLARPGDLNTGAPSKTLPPYKPGQTTRPLSPAKPGDNTISISNPLR